MFSTRVAAIVGGAVVVLAVAGGVLFLRHPAPETATYTQAAEPAEPEPAPDPSQPGTSRQGATPAAGPPPTDAAQMFAAEHIDFIPFVRPFSLAHDSVAYLAAVDTAPQVYELVAGTPVMSASLSKDGKWVIALTQSDQAVYLNRADLGDYKAPKAESDNGEIQGDAKVVDSATLMVNGQQVALDGLRGAGGMYAHQVQGFLDGQAKPVDCSPRTVGYVCKIGDGIDVGRVALYLGDAKPADDASPDYQMQAQAARKAHRGLWQ